MLNFNGSTAKDRGAWKTLGIIFSKAMVLYNSDPEKELIYLRCKGKLPKWDRKDICLINVFRYTFNVTYQEMNFISRQRIKKDNNFIN